MMMKCIIMHNSTTDTPSKQQQKHPNMKSNNYWHQSSENISTLLVVEERCALFSHFTTRGLASPTTLLDVILPKHLYRHNNVTSTIEEAGQCNNIIDENVTTNDE
mmetsp:Transcript_23017/g.41310  ORF Transcript_23017/g.41310 Transcript_23017/m.41310 type:complete len:105 (-) Transcript_23017:1089-1403(-)